MRRTPYGPRCNPRATASGRTHPGPDIGWLMNDTQRPTLITNPAGDLAFRDRAEAALGQSRSADELQEVLRQRYPQAVVRPRELAGERPIVWYVYREGHWVAHHDHRSGASDG